MEMQDGWEPTVSIPYSKWIELMKIIDEIIKVSREKQEIWDEIRKEMANNE